MVLHFNVKGENRKAMVRAIEQESGVKAKYLGVPSCAYEIGAYRVEKDGTLSFPGDIAESARVIDACVIAVGVSPTEWDNNKTETEKPDTEPNKGKESVSLRVTIPLEGVDVGNLMSLLEAKGELIQKALDISNTFIEEKDGMVEFPWFGELKPEEAFTYTRFISALCEMTVKQKRITAKPKENENEKYAFRCFILRLGFIGDEFKADRKILLSKLDGSAAFKAGAKKAGEQ